MAVSDQDVARVHQVDAIVVAVGAVVDGHPPHANAVAALEVCAPRSRILQRGTFQRHVAARGHAEKHRSLAGFRRRTRPGERPALTVDGAPAQDGHILRSLGIQQAFVEIRVCDESAAFIRWRSRPDWCFRGSLPRLANCSVTLLLRNRVPVRYRPAGTQTVPPLLAAHGGQWPVGAVRCPNERRRQPPKPADVEYRRSRRRVFGHKDR